MYTVEVKTKTDSLMHHYHTYTGTITSENGRIILTNAVKVNEFAHFFPAQKNGEVIKVHQIHLKDGEVIHGAV